MKDQRWVKWTLFPLAVLCGWALMEQFAGGFRITHSVLAAVLIAACYLLLRYALRPAGRRVSVLSALWGGALALVYIVGAGYTTTGFLLPEGPIPGLLLRFLGLGLFLACLPRAFYLSPWGRAKAGAAGPSTLRRWFFVSWGVLVVCYLPYFFYYYPGIFSNDTITQFFEAYYLSDLTNAHPILHTLLLRACLAVGDWAGIEYRLVYGALTCLQMIGLAAVLAYAVTLLRKFTKQAAFPIFALLLFGLNPLHGFFSVTLWKDIPFSAMLLMLTLLLAKAVYEEENPVRKPAFWIAYLISGLAVLSFRPNGFLVLLFASVLLVCLWREKRLFFAVTGGVFCIAYGVVQLLIAPALDAPNAPVTEILSVPIQQVARAVWREEPLTQEQTDLIEYVIPIEEIKKLYNPRITDPIKFSSSFYGDGILERGGEYFQLWLSVLREHPATALEAHLCLASAFFYPDQIPGTTVYWPNEVINEWDAEFYHAPLVPGLSWIESLNPNRLQREVPVLNLFALPGVLIWVLLFSLLILYACGRRKAMLICLPALGLWITLMLGAPVSDPRYAYALYFIAPLLLGLSLAAKGEKAQ